MSTIPIRIDMLNKAVTPMDEFGPSLQLVEQMKSMPPIAHKITNENEFDILHQTHNSYLNTITISIKAEKLDKEFTAVFAHAKETALHNFNTSNQANNVRHITILLQSGGVIKWLTISVHQGSS